MAAAIAILAFVAFLIPLTIASARRVRMGGLITFVLVAGAAALFVLPLSLTLLWLVALVWACVAEPQPRRPVAAPPAGWSQTPARKVTIDPETLAAVVTKAAPIVPPSFNREQVLARVPRPGGDEPSAWERMHS